MVSHQARSSLPVLVGVLAVKTIREKIVCPESRLRLPGLTQGMAYFDVLTTG